MTTVDDIRYLNANGQRLAYISRGSGPLVLCVHGFPDTAYSFVPVLDRLAEAGYHAVAPFLRGYPPSCPAEGSDLNLTVAALAEDLFALADALDAPQFFLVGHDWGAVASYSAAALKPERILGLVTAAVPHPAHAIRNLSMRQLRRSFYTLFIQLPRLPDWWFARQNYRALERLIYRWSPALPPGHPEVGNVKQAFYQPGGFKAALAYYRFFIPRQFSRKLAELRDRVIKVPVLIIHGEQDGCVGAENFAGQEAWFSAGLSIDCWPDAGHFVQWEQPQRFADSIISFFNRH